MWGAEARSPDAAQRAVLHGVVRRRAGAVTNAGAWYGPGTAERHEVCRTASGTRDGKSPPLGALFSSLRAKRSNPEPRTRKDWIASSEGLLAMTELVTLRTSPSRRCRRARCDSC